MLCLLKNFIINEVNVDYFTSISWYNTVIVVNVVNVVNITINVVIDNENELFAFMGLMVVAISLDSFLLNQY